MLALDGVCPTNWGYDTILFVALQLPLLYIGRTARALVGCFGIALLLHVGITIVCPTEGFVTVRTVDNATMRNLLMVRKRSL